MINRKSSKITTKVLQLSLFIGLSLMINDLKAQDFSLGLRSQKTMNMYFENGLSASYSFKDFKPKKFYLGFDYVTSRIGTAFQSNAIKQDNFLLSASWVFHEEKSLRFISRINFGYFYSDLEEDIFKDLPNTSILFSPEVGLQYDFKDLPLRIKIGTGFYVLTSEAGYSPGTLQPVFYHLDIHYRIFKSTTDE